MRDCLLDVALLVVGVAVLTAVFGDPTVWGMLP